MARSGKFQAVPSGLPNLPHGGIGVRRLAYRLCRLVSAPDRIILAVLLMLAWQILREDLPVIPAQADRHVAEFVGVMLLIR